jgi:hypothetical protein
MAARAAAVAAIVGAAVAVVGATRAGWRSAGIGSLVAGAVALRTGGARVAGMERATAAAAGIGAVTEQPVAAGRAVGRVAARAGAVAASSVHPLPSSLQLVPAGAAHVSAASLQVRLHSGPPAQGSPMCTPQVPAAHVSAPLQKTPSSHGAVFAGCTHWPVPLHASVVQTLPSLAQGPGASASQVAEQQSPETTLPSSHASPASRSPSPQRASAVAARWPTRSGASA